MNNIKNQDITITPKLRNGKHLNVPVSISDVENFTAKFYTKDISHNIEKEQPNGNDITITWNELLTLAEGELNAFYAYDYDGQHIQYADNTGNYIDNNLSEGRDTEFALSIGGGSTPQSIPDIVKGMWVKVTYNFTDSGNHSLLGHNHGNRFLAYAIDGEIYKINTTEEVTHTFADSGVFDVYFLLGEQNGGSGYRYEDNFIFRPVVAMNFPQVEYCEWNTFLAMSGLTDITINAVAEDNYLDINNLGELPSDGVFHVKTYRQYEWLHNEQTLHHDYPWSTWTILQDATEAGEDFLAVQLLNSKVNTVDRQLNDRISALPSPYDLGYIKGMWSLIHYSIPEAGTYQLITKDTNGILLKYAIDGNIYDRASGYAISHTFDNGGEYDVYFMVDTSKVGGIEYAELLKNNTYATSVNFAYAKLCDYHCFVGATSLNSITLNNVTSSNFLNTNNGGLNNLPENGTFNVKGTAAKEWLEEKQQARIDLGEDYPWLHWNVMEYAEEVGTDCLAIQALNKKIDYWAQKITALN